MDGDIRTDDLKANTIAVNKVQAQYYEQANGSSASDLNSWATNIWRKMRQRGIGAVTARARNEIYAIHKDWMGDLSQARVLELGSGAGSFLTKYMVENCAAYHAIDLSSAKIAQLRAKYGHLPHAKFFAGDFLADDFVEGDYDIIYAHAVFHHFRHIDVLFDRVDQKMKPTGRMITFDPLQTWLPARMLRALFRPFQTDAAWEFPFSHKTLDGIARRYRVVDQFGLYGRAKWALMIGIFAPKLGSRLGDTWFRKDFESGYVKRNPRSCLMICLHLQNKTVAGNPSAEASR